MCGGEVEPIEVAPHKVQQVAELVEQPIEIWEYHRSMYQCPNCGWSGYSPLPWGVKEGFSYGGRLCSIVGWLGYGGNLTWRKQEYFALTRLGYTHLSGELGQNAALVSGESGARCATRPDFTSGRVAQRLPAVASLPQTAWGKVRG